MKILIYAWNIYHEDLSELEGKPNGGNIAIKNICEYVGRKCELYLFLGRKKISAKKVGHIHIVDTNRYPDFMDENLGENERRLKTMLHAFENVIKELRPDFVNIHGGGELAKLCIIKCIEMNEPYAFTRHLYLGLEKEPKKYDVSYEWENQVFSIPDIKITAVGSMMKENILRDYPMIKETDIEVILNGTDFTYQKSESNIREKYHLTGKKILLCVGTILERKNQMQVVRAFSLIPEEQRKNLAIIFCGADAMQGALQNKIEKLHLEQSLIYAGVVPNSEINKYYSIADGYILPSIKEGLSLAMLEALVFGLPIIIFDDVGGASDLADEKVTQFICKKEDQDVADAIVQWLNKSWDKEYIRKYAEYFNMERVADDYINYYKRRINEDHTNDNQQE